jgi:hypothetical protein
MKRNLIIQKTNSALATLSDDKLIEVAHFVNYLVEKQRMHELTAGVQKLVEASKVFEFIGDGADLYTIADIKE